MSRSRVSSHVTQCRVVSYHDVDLDPRFLRHSRPASQFCHSPATIPAQSCKSPPLPPAICGLFVVRSGIRILFLHLCVSTIADGGVVRLLWDDCRGLVTPWVRQTGLLASSGVRDGQYGLMRYFVGIYTSSRCEYWKCLTFHLFEALINFTTHFPIIHHGLSQEGR